MTTNTEKYEDAIIIDALKNNEQNSISNESSVEGMNYIFLY